MNPFDEELGETQSVRHQGGVMQVNAKAVRLDMNMGGDFLTDEAQTIRSGASATIKGGVIMSESLCYDGYNQSGHEEVCMTIRSACGGTERNDATPKVAVGFKAGQSKDGGLGDEREVSPTLSHKPSALEPTVAQDNGIKCLNPQDQQTGRVYDPSGAMTSLQAGGGVSGMRRESVLMADNLAAMRYIVRRLTPTECERLMGLPDGYTIPVGLDPNDPALVEEFQRIHDTFGAIMAEYEHKKPPKPKSAKQVADWLKKVSDPATCPDSPRYKGCGNGMATNQPRWIFTRMLTMEGIEW